VNADLSKYVVQEGPFAGARVVPPTQKHFPAMWECMLGTVYASNGVETRYFDYRWEEARAFCGADLPGADLRIAKCRFGSETRRVGQRTLYVHTSIRATKES
jgi:hypothetical protein